MANATTDGDDVAGEHHHQPAPRSAPTDEGDGDDGDRRRQRVAERVGLGRHGVVAVHTTRLDVRRRARPPVTCWYVALFDRAERPLVLYISQ